MKVKSIWILAIFLTFIFLPLEAEVAPSYGYEKDIENITDKVFPSVVTVEAGLDYGGIKYATGVIVDKEGYIVTTALVSPPDQRIYVTTSDGKRISAKFLGLDSLSHLALIKAQKDHKFTPVEMGKLKDVSPGSWVGVISVSPEGGPAIMQGIISSMSEEKLRLNVYVVQGASGSPVVDRNGKMVGILRGTYYDESPVIMEFQEKKVVGKALALSRVEAPASGMAIAIPIGIVNHVASEIRTQGKVRRGWLGIYAGLNSKGQVEIQGIEEGSPADKAKIEEGDIILEIDGKDVTNAAALKDKIIRKKSGDVVVLKIKRENKTDEYKVKLGEKPEGVIASEFMLKFPSLFKTDKIISTVKPELSFYWESRKHIGIKIEDLNRELSKHFGVAEGESLIISEVVKDSPAEKAGLEVGDIIVRADGDRIEKAMELIKKIQEKERGEKIEIEVLRDKKAKKFNVEIEEGEKSYPFLFNRYWDGDFYIQNLQSTIQNLNQQLKKWKKYYPEAYEENVKSLKKEIEWLSKILKKELKEKAVETKKSIKLVTKNGTITI